MWYCVKLFATNVITFLVLWSPRAATMVNTGKRLSSTLLLATLAHIAAGKNSTEVLTATGVFCHTVEKLQLRLEYWGQCYPPSTVKLKRHPLLRQAQLKAMEEYF